MAIFKVVCDVISYAVLSSNVKEIKIELQSNGIIDEIKIFNKSSLDLIGKTFSNSLIIQCIINANTIFEAIGLCHAYTERILDQISFVAGTPVYELNIRRAFDISPNTESRDYIQFDYDIIDKIGSRMINLHELLKTSETVNSMNSDRLFRALHWCRKALRENDPLDRFTYIWTGLEVLNPLFRDLYHNEYEVNKCENCGH